MTAETAALRGPLRKRESNLWERQEHDWYVEPVWCSGRLFEEEPFRGFVWDPACGQGNILTAGRVAGIPIFGSDIVARFDGCEVKDFVHGLGPHEFVDNIVSNPPFGLCDDRKAGTYPFVEQALRYAMRKVALLMPANWVQGDKRSRWLETTPLRRVWFISPRPSMPPGDVLAAGAKPGNGTTDFAWFVWVKNYDGRPEIRWLRRTP